ncbi:MAG: HP0495 family protein [Burkholderiaceae bacterium]
MSSEINQTFDRIEALLEFPCDFPIKVIGLPNALFESTVAAVVSNHIDHFDAARITATQSRTGKFVSLTVNVQVETREQLQGIYMALANHQMVRMVI